MSPGTHSTGSSHASAGPSSGGAPSGGGGGGGGSSTRTYTNQQQLRYFAAGICGLMAIFIVTHWLRIVFNKLSPASKNPIRSASRIVRNLLVRKVPGFTSSGHVLVVAAYVAINLALTFTNVTISSSGIANRCGWMLVANFCVVVFLALKNTPLAVLSAYSYERLNGLHQIAGYTTFVYLVLHASLYAHYFINMGMTEMLEGKKIKAGIVAAFGFLGAVVAAAVVRRVWYEVFFALHVACFLVALVAASFHQPDLAENGLLVMFAVIAGMWGADRLVRGGRMLFGLVAGHRAVVEPLPDGGTRIVLAGRPAGAAAAAGKHCFVWIPAVRWLESHPFTIAGTGPVEFVVHARDGFTRDLHAYAAAHPGASLRASVDGPYGTFPDPMSFDKVVLIAGGSGATFTFGLAVNMLERMGPGSTKNIVFIWAVKKHENLSWFADHLRTLKEHPHSPKVNVSLYVTSSSSESSSPESSDAEDDRRAPAATTITTTTTTTDGEKNATTGNDASTKTTASRTLGHQNNNNNNNNNSGSNGGGGGGDDDDDPEKAIQVTTGAPGGADASHGHELRPGRPATAALIREAVLSTPHAGRVLVAACGPSGLMRTVRDTTAGLIRPGGPGVELHCEQFGW